MRSPFCILHLLIISEMASSSSSSSESFSCTCPWLLMERLWFQRSVVLSPRPPISTATTTSNINTAEPPSSNSSSSFSSESNPSSNTSSSTIDCSDEDLAHIFHETHGSLPIITITPQDEEDEEEKNTIKMTKQARKKTKPGSSRPRRLERTLSCKTLAELQQEEVKGFLDLGFIFDKDHVTPHMMSVVPGLQSVEEHENRHKEEEVGKGNNSSSRGYLSEAWMVERPDSPLLRLRMSRHSTTSADMKKHLKLWAKAVASTSAAHP